MKKKKKFPESMYEPEPSNVAPLSAFSVFLSVSSICNATARWLVSNNAALADVGGYQAANEMQAVGEFLLAVCEESGEKWQKIMVEMPKGFGHAPMFPPPTPDEGKGDLPF